MESTRFPFLPSSLLLALLGAPGLQAQTVFQPKKSLVLNTASQKIGSKVFKGGIFVFNRVQIDQGIRVHAEGPNPLILVSLGDLVVNGRLDGDGQNAPNVDTLNSANFPSPGGKPGPAGGAGGRGSPNSTGHSPGGEMGFGPFGILGLGGVGGLANTTGGISGAGGGGGSFSTKGDPYFPLRFDPKTLRNVQQIGFGGFGQGRSKVLGGAPGSLLLFDRRKDNDFWGWAVDVHQKRLIHGEILRPFGGSGGGGGGDRYYRPNFRLDEKGAGGGGGGGAVLVYALGKIIVGPKGQISANGGDGGGGEPGGSSQWGGAGGGGSGGMVILASRKGIDLHVHGGTYGEKDNSFSVSADGGVSGLGKTSSEPFSKKYAFPPSRSMAGNLGGLGGMGIVQFIVPVDGKNRDGTNTILDDRVRILRNGKPLTGAQKQKYLAWRGFPNKKGVWVDDKGNPIRLGDQEGDIRPSPILMPLWF